MIKNSINRLIKGSSRKSRTLFERRMVVIEQAMSERTSRDYNPRKARNRSLKGIVFSSK